MELFFYIFVVTIIIVVTLYIFIQNSYYAKFRFFYPQSKVKDIIAKYINKEIQDSEFINSSIYVYGRCYGNGKKLSIKINNDIITKEIPYKEIIDYTLDNDYKKIEIKANSPIGQYNLPVELQEYGKCNYDEFLLHKNASTRKWWQKRANLSIEELEKPIDRLALSMKSLQKKQSSDTYECELQSCYYSNTIKTALTIDLPFANTPLGQENSMRTKDFVEEGKETADNGKLKELSESKLANIIGASAVWCTPCTNCGKAYEKQFFLKPRDKGTAIFADVLGTISGTVMFPTNDSLSNYTHLEDYVKQEMLRIFLSGGYREYMEEKGLCEKSIEIKLLTFTREFARGGQPQFFFIIQTPEISNSDMKKYFNNLHDGKKKFSNSFISRRLWKRYRLSSETEANFLYALSYLQKNQRLNYIDLDYLGKEKWFSNITPKLEKMLQGKFS